MILALLPLTARRLVSHTFYASLRVVDRLWRWGWGMPVPVSDDRIIIEFDLDEPVELEALTEGLAALARQYQKFLLGREFDPQQYRAKLYVTRLQSGSIETEIAFWTQLLVPVIVAMDYAVIATDFTDRVRECMMFFARRGPRPDALDRDDASDFGKFIEPIVGKKGAKLRIKRARYHKKTESREILAEYEFDEGDLANAGVTIDLEQEQPLQADEARRHKIERNVLLYWYQTNRAGGKSSGWTGDRGIIQAITDKPLQVYFPKNSVIKPKMTGGRMNPFYKGFMVDVDVQYANDKPAVYTVLELHDTVDLPLDEGQQGLPFLDDGVD